MILGLNISHNASASLTTDNGLALFAVEEERLSRIKNHVGIPRKSIQILSEQTEIGDLEQIIIGSNNNLTRDMAHRMVANLEKNPSNKEGLWTQPFPGGFSKQKTNDVDPKTIIEMAILDLLPEKFAKINFVWEKHHDSHIGCALSTVSSKESLLVSLDGEGDGESGAIAVYKSGVVNYLARIPKLDSLGLMYSAVTKRYNFIPNKHDGKITGLAAFGNHTAAVELLCQHIVIREGIPKVIRANDLKAKLLSPVLSKLGINLKSFQTMHQIIDLAESKTTAYPDLAYAIQSVLEKSVLEIIDFWVKKTKIKNVALSGGVFANVKLNQKISELQNVLDVGVFPNMGDGGIALGGIWSYLSKNRQLSLEPYYESMYLAPNNLSTEKIEIESLKTDEQLMQVTLPESNLYKAVCDDIISGSLVAVHNGQMEFGPRALGNRSLLLDPRKSTIVKSVNDRLNRTEFMPFAPVIMEEHFQNYFQISPTQSLQPYYYMTMTCNVMNQVRQLIPAVVHVDGTARPQIVNRTNNYYLYNIIDQFYKLTGIPLLVNTSLNVHEEPINCSVSDTVKILKSGKVDVVYFGHTRIELKKSPTQ